MRNKLTYFKPGVISMKERIQHFTLILLVLLIIVGGIALFLNNASYNPDFSVIDAISGATKKTHSDNDKSETVSSWGYTKEDIALSEELFSNYTEEMIVIAGNTYRVLENTSDKNTDKIVLLSDKGNKEYQRAVQNIADYLKEQGYHVRIKECSETMMLSLVHAGHFDIFLMSEEVAQ